MKVEMMLGRGALMAAATLSLLAPLHVLAADVDVEAAEATARREGCLKCHGVDKKKDGPAYQQVAKKYKDKPDAEDRLFKHVTTGPIVKMSSGEEEEHKIIKTKDQAEIRNLIQWILSR